MLHIHIYDISRLRVKSTGLSVQSTTGNRGVGISGSNAGYTKFRGSVKGTDYSLHSPVFPSIPLSCVIVCHQVSTGLWLPPNPGARYRGAELPLHSKPLRHHSLSMSGVLTPDHEKKTDYGSLFYNGTIRKRFVEQTQS